MKKTLNQGTTMHHLIKTLVLLSVMLLSLNLAAKDAPQRDLQTILDSGELRVGVALFSPWVMRAKDGQLIGSELDMARRLAADMGIKPEIGLYEWTQLIPALEKGEIDIIISGMGIKPNRALRVNFSRPYGDAGIGLAANTKLTKNFKSIDELKQPNINIGVQEETVSASVAQRMFSKTTIKTYPTQEALVDAVLKGELHAMIAANPLPKFVTLQNPKKVDMPLVKPLLAFKEGLAINKGDADFLNFINSWVVARTADAWIPSTRRYWLESLEWQGQVK
jgi:polar amino acid transport system substrate-binding protein